MQYIPLILLVVSTNALSQILLKQGMTKIGSFDFAGSSVATIVPAILLNPYVVGGLLVMVMSMGLHLMVLSRVQLSFAYPFLSISYVLVLVAGYYLFGETISTARVGGVALICVGTALIARS